MIGLTSLRRPKRHCVEVGYCIGQRWWGKGFMSEALDMLMDHEMDEAERSRIKEIVRGHDRVLNLHDLRTRAAGRDRFIQFHLELDGGLSLIDAHRITETVEADVRKAFPEAEVIIHQDPAGVVDRRNNFRYH